MRFKNHFTLPLYLSLFAICGCGDSTVPATTPEQLAPINESATSADTPEISEAEAIKFGKKWETAVRTGDVVAGKQLFWFDASLKRALSSFDLTPEMTQSFMTGVKSSAPVTNLIKQLAANETAGGTYRLVRVVTRGSDRHAVYRMLGPEGALNYHDLRIVRDGGQLRADKFFVAMTGESISDTMKSTIAPLVAQQSVVGRLTGGQAQEMKKLELQRDITRASKSGNAELVLTMYEQLPADVQSLKLMQIQRLTALSSIDEREDDYLKAIELYEKDFPNDPSLGLISIDGAVMRDDMQLLDKSHQNLNRWSAGDAYLDLMIACVMSNSGKIQRAEEIIKDADIASLGLASAHDFRMTIALGSDDHAETLKQLVILRDDYGYEFSDLREAEGFEAFTESPQFATWTDDSQ